MSQNNKKKYARPSSSQIDATLFTKLADLLDSKNEDLTPLIEFINKDYLDQIIQSWSFYSSTNDAHNFTDATIKINRFVQFCNNHDELHSYGADFIKKILNLHIKILYRALNNSRPSITNPALRLINSILRFKSGRMIDTFLNTFDFTLKSLPKLLVPTKSQLEKEDEKDETLSIRYNIITVLSTLIQNSSSIQRKEFLTNNKKILTNWFKYFSSDSARLLTNTINLIEEKILQESNFRKTTKCKVLNETFLINILALFEKSSSAELIEILHQFILKLATDFKNGLVFHDDKTWLSGSNGAPVTINNVTFKIYNKLIYNLIINLRPWSDVTQLDILSKILSALPELIPPYNNYLVSISGYHDPKLSSFWIGHTLVHTSIINTDIPRLLYDLSSTINEHNATINVNNNLVIENIVPASMSKLSFTKCLQSEKLLIRQLSAQQLVNIFIKLKKVLVFYSDRNWNDSKLQLLELVKSRVPDVSTIVNILNEVYFMENQKKILVLMFFKVLCFYAEIWGVGFSLSNFKVFESFRNFELSNFAEEGKFSGLDLQILDSFLNLQDNYNENTISKWWNSTGEKSSLFTQLLKLNSLSFSSIDSTNSQVDKFKFLNLKVIKLLQKLVDTTTIFDKGLVASQIYGLVYSLPVLKDGFTDSKDSITIFWKLIDETISRSVRAPFKYIDMSKNLNKLSPFIITLFEQFKFVNKTDPYYHLVLKWLVLFVKYMIILGEDKKSLLMLVNQLDTNVEILTQTYLNFEEVEVFNPNKDQQTLFGESFFVYVTECPFMKLSLNIGTAADEFDISGILFRLKTIIEANLTYEKSSNIILQLYQVMGDYLTSNSSPDLIMKLCNEKTWSGLFIKDWKSAENQKLLYSSHLFNELMQQLLDPKSPSYATFNLKSKSDLIYNNEYNSWIDELCLFELSEVNQKLLSQCLWIMSDTQLIKNMKTTNKSLQIDIFREINLRKLVIDDFFFIIEILQNAIIPESFLDVISEMIDLKLIEPSKFYEDIINVIMSNPKLYKLIRSLIQNDSHASTHLVDNFISLEDKYMLCYIGAFLDIEFINNYSNKEHLKNFYDSVTSFAINVINENEFDKISFKELLKVFVNSFELIDDTSRCIIIEKCLQIDNKLLFSPEISALILRYIIADKADSEHGQLISSNVFELIKPWLHRSALYMNKKFAESVSLSENFLSFVESYGKLAFQVQLWRLVPKDLLNAQLEICLMKWASDTQVLEYISILLLGGSKNIIEFEKILQIFINNDSILLSKGNSSCKGKYYSALILWILFNFDVTKNSTLALQSKMILLYSGSIKAEDLLVKDILYKVEAKVAKSWINHVSNWELVEEMTTNEIELVGDLKLITKEKNSLVVSLNKKFIRNTIKNYNVLIPPVPSVFANKLESSWNSFESFYSHLSTLSENDCQSTVYDSEFLLMLIINNEELFSISDGESSTPHFNIKKLLDADLFEFIVMNLASQKSNIQQITKIVLNGILKSLESDLSYRDRNVFKVLVSNILCTLRELKEGETVTPLIWCFISRLVPILNNPGHVLYEKAFRLISTNPQIHTKTIPLYYPIVNAIDNEDDSYYKQITWLLETLIHSVKVVKDLDILKFKGVIEWVLNLFSSPYLSFKIQTLILEFISALQSVNSGSDLLISRFGVLAHLEQNLTRLQNELNTEGISLKDRYINENLSLNIKELIIRFGITISKNKRIRNWTFEDIGPTLKRLHS